MLKGIGVLFVAIVTSVGCVDPPEQRDTIPDTGLPDAGGLSIDPSVVECPEGFAPAVRRISARGEVDPKAEIREESLFGIGRDPKNELNPDFVGFAWAHISDGTIWVTAGRVGPGTSQFRGARLTAESDEELQTLLYGTEQRAATVSLSTDRRVLICTFGSDDPEVPDGCAVTDEFDELLAGGQVNPLARIEAWSFFPERAQGYGIGDLILPRFVILGVGGSPEREALLRVEPTEQNFMLVDGPDTVGQYPRLTRLAPGVTTESDGFPYILRIKTDDGVDTPEVRHVRANRVGYVAREVDDWYLGEDVEIEEDTFSFVTWNRVEIQNAFIKPELSTTRFGFVARSADSEHMILSPAEKLASGHSHLRVNLEGVKTIRAGLGMSVFNHTPNLPVIALVRGARLSVMTWDLRTGVEIFEDVFSEDATEILDVVVPNYLENRAQFGVKGVWDGSPALGLVDVRGVDSLTTGLCRE